MFQFGVGSDFGHLSYYFKKIADYNGFKGG